MKSIPSKTRRKFIKDAAIATAAFSIVPRHVLGAGYIAPSDKVNIGLVGAGGRGKNNLKQLMQLDQVQVTALADPAQYWDLSNFYYQTEAGSGPIKKFLEEHYQQQTPNFQVATYQDFKQMLEKESLDGVLCATPDHTHAYVCLNALDAGLPVYCEKPLTHNIWEARTLKKKATESGLATQMGNQLHSSERLRTTVEYLKAGVLGNITQVYAWVGATRWNAGLRGQPTDSTPQPEGLNWDLWIGPRKQREFHEVYAPVSWRDFWDFGCGAMGDFGCHDLDAPVWGLNLPAPETVEMFPAGFSNAEITPYGEIGYFHFPATTSNGPVQLTWYSGGLRPQHPDIIPQDVSFAGRGALYIGEKGAMLYSGGSPLPQLFPKSLEESVKDLKPQLKPTKGHHLDWIEAIKGGDAASSYFEYGAHLTEITLLGVLSLRLGGKKIYWDAEHMKAKGLPEADQYIREEERSGWEMG